MHDEERLRRSSSGVTFIGDGGANADTSIIFSHPTAAAHVTTSRRNGDHTAPPVLRLEGTWYTNTVAHGSDWLRRWVASVEAAELVVDLSDILEDEFPVVPALRHRCDQRRMAR